MEQHREAAAVMAAECLCFRARRVSRALTRLYDEALRPLGIQATQLTLMNAVVMFGDGGAPMSRLADVLALDVTTLSRNLRPLVKDGLVGVERSPADRRVRVVHLTPEGAKRVASALPLWKRAQERVVSVLGPELAAELLDGFDAAVVAATGEPVVPKSPTNGPLRAQDEKEHTMRMTPYLNFDGQCAEAFRFYERVLGGTLEVQTHGDSPIAEHVPPEWHDRILHARLVVGDAVLMGSDTPPNEEAKPQGMAVSLQVRDAAEADRIFAALVEGGSVTMPLEKTFWAERFGMLVDRFGIPWMVGTERPADSPVAAGGE